MDPRVKPEDDKGEVQPEDDKSVQVLDPRVKPEDDKGEVQPEDDKLPTSIPSTSPSFQAPHCDSNTSL